MEDVTSGRLVETVQVGPYDANLLPMPGSERDTVQATPTFPDAYLQRAPAGTPAWWVRRLVAKMDQRKAQMQRWEDYYEGRQPLAFATERFREAFGGRFRAFSSNFMSLVVDGTRERMEVAGFDFTNQRSAKKAWQLWQDNSMDAASQVAHTEALVKSVVYTLVTPGMVGEAPLITIEDAYDAITEDDPSGRRRLAGLKRYVDDYGRLVLFLYLPEYIWKLRTTSVWQPGGSLQLEPWPGEDATWPLRNPFGVVPLTPLYNRPRLHGRSQSEVAAVMSNQDAVNKYRADALVAAEYAAFRQRWATGLEVPLDPETGQPIEPFKAAIDRLWVVPPPDPDSPVDMPEAKFGEFSATDLAPYQLMIQSEVGAISSISRMPYHYLLGQPDAVPPSGESLKSSEAGLISKVRTQLIHFGEGWEDTIRLALLAAGDERGYRDRAASTAWRDPETRNEGARTDATVKAYESGIIDRNEARQALGYAITDATAQPAAEPAPEASATMTGIEAPQ